MTFNLYGDDWEREEDGFRTIAVGERLGADLLGASLYEVASGESTWPYHFHHSQEELLIVLSGRLTVRTPAGERELGAARSCCSRPGRQARTRSGTQGRSRRGSSSSRRGRRSR